VPVYTIKAITKMQLNLLYRTINNVNNSIFLNTQQAIIHEKVYFTDAKNLLKSRPFCT